MKIADYTPEIERALLSAILYDPSSFEEIYSRLQSDDFSVPLHKNLFIILTELYNNDLPFDEEFILKKSTAKFPIDRAEIVSIIGTNPIVGVSAYINEIKNRSTKRKLAHLALLIKQKSEQQEYDSEDILDTLEQELYKLSQQIVQHDFRESEEITASTIELIKTIKEKGNSTIVGINTGFRDLNKFTAGFGIGDLIIIAARPSMGKTAFALNITLKNLEQNMGGVVIFSLEMSAEQLMLRLLSNKTSIALQDLRIGNLDDDQWQRLSDAANALSKMQLFVDDGGILTISSLRTKMRKLKSKNPNIKLVIVDYLQLMSSGSSNRDRHVEVSDISRGLKMLARELQIPIIALSQLNRALEARSDRRPMLSDLRESGSIEQDADLILFIYRDEVYKQKAEKEKEEKARQKDKPYKSNFEVKSEETVEIIVGKQRNGPTGTIELIFHKSTSRFVDKNDIYENEEQANTKLQIPHEVEIPMV